MKLLTWKGAVAVALAGCAGLTVAQTTPTIDTNPQNQTYGGQFAPIQLETYGVPTVWYNGQQVTFANAAPGIYNGTLLIPVREFAQQEGCTVHWNPETKTIDIAGMNKTYTVDVLQPAVALDFLNGRAETLADSTAPSEAVLIGDRAYLKIDDLARTFGGTANWDHNTNVAKITVPVG